MDDKRLRFLMDDFTQYASILTLNMLLDAKFPDPKDRIFFVDLIVGKWEQGMKQALSKEASILHSADEKTIDVEEKHVQIVKEITLTSEEIKRILNGQPA